MVLVLVRREGRVIDEDEDVIVRGAVVDEDDVVVVDVVVVEEVVRFPRTGGVATRAGVLEAEEGLGVDGLDHDSKKSSSPSTGGVSTPVVSTPSTCMPFGYLETKRPLSAQQDRRKRERDAPSNIFFNSPIQLFFIQFRNS